jgi:hypothetical protein
MAVEIGSLAPVDSAVVLVLLPLSPRECRLEVRNAQVRQTRRVDTCVIAKPIDVDNVLSEGNRP